MTKTIRVFITKVDNDKLKVTWQTSVTPFDAYCIDLQIINNISDEIRTKLKDLVNSAMDTSKKPVNNSDYLFKIAEKGKELYDALFTPAAREPDPTKEIKEWIRRLQHPSEVLFIVDNRVHIPWGLIFDADLPNSKTSDIGSYGGFWCLKYSLSTVYSKIKPFLDDKINHKTGRFISVINDEVYKKAYSLLDHQEQTLINRNFSTFESHISSKAFYESWLQSPDDINFLYFYCHANETQLSLSLQDQIKTKDFHLKLKKNSSIPCLVFLNGCSTASGRPSGGFIEATGQNGFCGFIGTETVVPDVFALRFSMEFIYHLISTNSSIIQIMDDLRKKHWPLSLIYGTYCYPVFSIADSSSEAEKPLTNNFSLLNLGSEKLNV